MLNFSSQDQDSRGRERPKRWAEATETEIRGRRSLARTQNSEPVFDELGLGLLLGEGGDGSQTRPENPQPRTGRLDANPGPSGSGWGSDRLGRRRFDLHCVDWKIVTMLVTNKILKLSYFYYCPGPQYYPLV